MKFFTFLTALLLCATSIHAQDTTRVLFIGNSYVYTNDLPEMLRLLSASGGKTIIKDQNTPGGYTLQGHSTNAPSLAKIAQGGWDYVILQEQSQMPSFPIGQVTSDVFPYARILDSLIRVSSPCAETMFFMTWGRKYGDASNCAFYPPLCTFEGMQARLRESYLEMANDNQALAAPVGEAFKYSRMADSTINLYSPDNSHPSLAGTYLAACTFYATIFETSPVGSSFPAGINATQAAFLQQIAHQTVFDSLSVWNINEFEPQASFTYTTNGSGPYTYEFTSTSSNANSYLWSEGATTSSFTHTFAGAGVYTISLIVSNGCTMDTVSQEILVSPFSALSENKANLFTLNYQNQTLHINYASGSQAPMAITIFDALGKQIYQTNSISNQSENINTSQWSKGIYFVECRNNSQLITKKISIH